MCHAIAFIHNGKEHVVYFKDYKAVVPVRTKSRGTLLVPWGRQQHQAGRLPLGGWARHSDIVKGKWNKWLPKPVKLCLTKFMELDIEAIPHWFPLVKSHYIQGLLANEGDEYRVYIVTVEPELHNEQFLRWPRSISN
jgi:hypothetical protein